MDRTKRAEPPFLGVEEFPIGRFLSDEALASLTPEQSTALQEYLSDFALFDGTVLACHCGVNLGALPNESIVSVLGLSTFTWGLAHGEGFCSECSWPARGVHRVEVPGSESPLYFRVPLPYHPKNVEARNA